MREEPNLYHVAVALVGVGRAVVRRMDRLIAESPSSFCSRWETVQTIMEYIAASRRRMPILELIGTLGLILLVGCHGLTEKAVIDRGRSRDVVSLTPGEFSSVAMQGPTSLSLITVFVTKDNCAACSEAIRSLVDVSKKFRSLHKEERNTIFISVTIDPESEKDMKFAGELRLEYVPLLYNFRKLASKKRREPIKKTDRELFSQKQVPSVESIYQFVQLQTGKRMPNIRSGPVLVADKILHYRYEIITATVLGFLIALFLGLHRQWKFWYVIVCLVLTFSLAGGHYTLIHNSPLFVWQGGMPSLFSGGGQRSQYLFEGLTWSVIVATSATCILLLRSIPAFEFGIQTKALITYVSLSSTLIIFIAASSMYKIKNPSYLMWTETSNPFPVFWT